MKTDVKKIVFIAIVTMATMAVVSRVDALNDVING